MKIISMEIMHPKHGIWTVYPPRDPVNFPNSHGIGGKPSPSEGQAHKFDTEVIPRFEEAMAKIYAEFFGN
jgi:hypothetical protein